MRGRTPGSREVGHAGRLRPEEVLADAESPGAKRAMDAMLRMKKPDLAELRRAYEGAA